ncbi:hypothetical protein OCB02_18960 [Bacillus cereus]|uniref:hypothetical protein n=1 Tax=Bacillus cereus TaxID=1396 RepID=UPI0007B6CD80|nr:hypothetical protein [Bacillus cereus]ANC19293.1 hypothetical protein WR52_11105 [Bacillus cereus]MCC2447609.1 hypothetical protein [Bacillus cereus]MCU5477788.1 hypothetical protein [Bacillus cereus]MCU5615622.1 hypothetical protein [Bacillus cereus]
MSKKKIGSPPKYSDELLLAKLDEFLLKNPIEALNPSSLSKSTGIPRHVWMRRMGKQIDNLKEPTPKFFGDLKEDVIFPNIRELVEKNWNNKNQLIKDLSVFETVIKDLYQQACESMKYKNEKEKLTSKVKKLEEELKIAKSDVEYYKQELYKVSVKSKMTSERLNDNLENVLEINPKKKDSVEKATSGEFDKYFEGLFK